MKSDEARAMVSQAVGAVNISMLVKDTDISIEKAAKQGRTSMEVQGARLVETFGNQGARTPAIIKALLLHYEDAGFTVRMVESSNILFIGWG